MHHDPLWVLPGFRERPGRYVLWNNKVGGLLRGGSHTMWRVSQRHLGTTTGRFHKYATCKASALCLVLPLQPCFALLQRGCQSPSPKAIFHFTQAQQLPGADTCLVTGLGEDATNMPGVRLACDPVIAHCQLIHEMALSVPPPS